MININDKNSPEHRSRPGLLPFLLIVAAVAMSGAAFQPGTWYASLTKPFWTPPDWLFPPVWTLLYIMIAIAGRAIFSLSERRLRLLWIIQLALNALWSYLFFGLHLFVAGLVDILALLGCIGAILLFSRPVSPTVSWLMAPYFVWVAYATTLNAGLLALN